ncbi:MAG: hypothetical protein GY950_32690 [bacterium]|nr:hypothetical protein [bacterium]
MRKNNRIPQAGQAGPAPYTSHAPGRKRRELAVPVPRAAHFNRVRQHAGAGY